MRDDKVIGEVLIDERNIHLTAEHSRLHNDFNRERPVAEIRGKLLEVAFDKLKSPSFMPGEMLNAYDVWFVIDEFPKGTRFNSEPMDSNPPRYHLNFFVRLGRDTTGSITDQPL